MEPVHIHDESQNPSKWGLLFLEYEIGILKDKPKPIFTRLYGVLETDLVLYASG